jgi:hypothetical protein
MNVQPVAVVGRNGKLMKPGEVSNTLPPPQITYKSSVSDPNPGSGAFLSPGFGMGNKNQDLDPG